MSGGVIIEGENVEETIAEVQRAVVDLIREVISDLRKSATPINKQPGLTWEQLEFILNEVEKKKARVVVQSEPM